MGSKQLVLLSITIATLAWRASAAKVPALFIFGDSTVDTGNQNYITSIIKSNFAPYGKDFMPPGPTGRFSNGKLANDFLAEYLGIPSPVNYLAPEAKGSKLLTGVNLASSGSGYLDITGALFGVLNLTRQLDNFVLVKAQISQQIGEQPMEQLIRDSVYLISTGSNDFINSYNINPILQKSFTPDQYEKLLLDSIDTNLRTLYNYGARTVFIDSLSPLGCVPQQLLSNNIKDGSCVDKVNVPIRSFNTGLQSTVQKLRQDNPDYQLVYVNVYDTIFNAVANPSAYGFKFGSLACCGEGPYKGLPCIDPISDLCSNADDYIFWDLYHPTQKTYNLLFNGILSGGPSESYPVNLKQILGQ